MAIQLTRDGLPALIVGLAAEARIARLSGWPVGIGGGTEAGARAAAEAQVQDGARGLVSFGLAGGLAPELRAGSVVIPARVRVGSETLSTDLALSADLGGADDRCLLGHDTIVGSAEAKRALWLETGAVAVDLESGAVACVARAHGVPFAVLRVICDPAGLSLPPAAVVALDHAGAIGVLRVIGSLLRRPSQFPALMQLAADAATARRVLQQRARRMRSG